MTQKMKYLRNILILIMVLAISATSILAQDETEEKELSPDKAKTETPVNETSQETKNEIKISPKKKGKRGADEKEEDRTFTADWRNTDIIDFLKGMSGILNKNILLDESIKGKKITIISRKQIKVSEALAFMKTVLESQGFGVIEENNLIKIVVLKDAVAKSPDIFIGQEMDKKYYLNPGTIITQIVPLTTALATELDPLLKRITSKNTEIIVYNSTNTILLSGPASDIEKLVALIQKLDSKSEGPGSEVTAGDTHIYTLEYNNAEAIAAVLTKISLPGKTDAKIPNANAPKIQAVPHKESNSIIVTANDTEWKEIARIIKVLDQSRKQVLLEVLIVELTSTDLNDFGIDWRVTQGTGPGAQFNTGLAREGGVIDATGQITQVNTLGGFSLGFLKRGGQSIVGILNANSSNENFNVLSAPQVLTLDNQEAEINVGQDVPVRTQSKNAGVTDAAVTVDNYDYRPTGIKLKFTPHINKNDKITLDLFQQIKNIAFLEKQGGNPTFNTRDIKTSIIVDNTQTIVIGGLISNDNQIKISKIPLLGDIPVLGYFFRRKTNQMKKTNLMMFLTPHILSTRNIADRKTIQKRMEQENHQKDRERNLR